MSEIDRYLDELFDRLSGTGAAGRRALAEAEDHLRAAATDATAAGLPADQAERNAVTRFGSATMVARRLRSANGASRLNRTLSAAWLLAGLTACGLGVACLAAAGRLGWSAPECTVMLSSACYIIGSPLARFATCAALGSAVGAVLLLSRRLAITRAGLSPGSHGSVILASSTITMAGLAAGAAGQVPNPRLVLLTLTLPYPTYVVIAAAMLECLAAATLAFTERPRPVQLWGGH